MGVTRGLQDIFLACDLTSFPAANEQKKWTVTGGIYYFQPRMRRFLVRLVWYTCHQFRYFSGLTGVSNVD